MYVARLEYKYMKLVAPREGKDGVELPAAETCALDDDDEDLYKLVGEATGSFDVDYVEVTASSPMGEALMKARVGETVRVDLPKGAKRFEILEIV